MPDSSMERFGVLHHHVEASAGSEPTAHPREQRRGLLDLVERPGKDDVLIGMCRRERFVLGVMDRETRPGQPRGEVLAEVGVFFHDVDGEAPVDQHLGAGPVAAPQLQHVRSAHERIEPPAIQPADREVGAFRSRVIALSRAQLADPGPVVHGRSFSIAQAQSPLPALAANPPDRLLENGASAANGG